MRDWRDGVAMDRGEGSRRETLDSHACRRIWKYLGSAIESKKVLSKMYPRDYRVRESTCTSEVVGVEMAPVEYRTRRNIHATRDNEEGSKARLQSGDAGNGSARQRIRQAAKHGTVWRLGFTHVSAFETARHGGAVPWSKGPEPSVARLPSKSRVPSSPASVRVSSPGCWSFGNTAGCDACSNYAKTRGRPAPPRHDP